MMLENMWIGGVKMIKFFKRLFCKHNWEDGSHLPWYQTFVCSKCGKEIKYNPIRGFFR